MKCILQAMVVGVLFTGTQAMAGDGMIVLPSQWTNADRNAAEIKRAPGVNAFPSSSPDMIVLPSRSTSADRFGDERDIQARGASAPTSIQ
jgi:hypothetical protein